MVKKRYDSFWKFLKEDDGDKFDPDATNPGWKKATKKDEDEKEQEKVTKEAPIKPEYPKTQESPGRGGLTIPSSWYKDEKKEQAAEPEEKEQKSGKIPSTVDYYLSRPFQEFFRLEGKSVSLEPAVSSIKKSVELFSNKIKSMPGVSDRLKGSAEFRLAFQNPDQEPAFDNAVLGLSLLDKSENLVLFTDLNQFISSGEEFETKNRQFKFQTGDAGKRTFRSLKEGVIEFPEESEEDAQKRMNRANIERYEKWKRGERTYSDEAVKIAGQVLGKYGEAIFFIKQEMDDSLGEYKSAFSKFFTSWLLPEYEFFASLPSLNEIEKNKVVDFYNNFFEKGEKLLQFVGGPGDLEIGFINSLLVMFNERFRVLQGDFAELKKFFRPMVMYAGASSFKNPDELVIMEFKGGEVIAVPASKLSITGLFGKDISGTSVKDAIKKMKVGQMKGSLKDDIISSSMEKAKEEISSIKELVDQRVRDEGLDASKINLQALVDGEKEAVTLFPQEHNRLKTAVVQYKALLATTRKMMDVLNMVRPEYTIRVVEPSVMVDHAAKEHISLLEQAVKYVMKRLYEKKLVK